MSMSAQRIWHAMEYDEENPYPSEYAKTSAGKLEYFLLKLLVNATYHKRETSQSYWSGAYNAIGLYLSHPSYSPFVQPWEWSKGKPLEVTSWDMRGVMIGDRFMTQEEWSSYLATRARKDDVARQGR